MKDVQSIIETLKLKAHPEGGWYRRVYESTAMLPPSAIENGTQPRHLATSIYFLITRQNFSAFHRLKFDERWYHHSGDTLNIELLHADGTRETLTLGPAEEGFEPQAHVPAGTWFAARIQEGKRWALTGCSMSPGFHFADFELARREELLQAFPQHSEIICSLTRHSP